MKYHPSFEYSKISELTNCLIYIFQREGILQILVEWLNKCMNSHLGWPFIIKYKEIQFTCTVYNSLNYLLILSPTILEW